jgi:putative ABC transport system permease protein
VSLFSIALRNIRRNFSSYLIYFVSMVFSIMIYYVFTSIQYNEQVQQLQEVKKAIQGTFQASSVVIALFAGIFIWYSNSFFTKRRKKEVALYSLMGVKKKQIGRMLFYENLMMGILALTAGILLGSLLSKLFVMLLMHLMGYAISIRFAIRTEPVIHTAIVFSILFLITSIHGYTIIYRFKLIDLFKAETRGEREPKVSPMAAVLSVLLIGGGYLYYTTAKVFSIQLLLLTLFLVVAGTYFLFSSLTVYIVKLAKRNKSTYYKGSNLISTSQLMFRLKGHYKTLATIAVLSATTLTAMGVTASFYYDFHTRLSSNYPFSYVYLSEKSGLDKSLEDVMANYPEHKILQQLNLEFLQMSAKLPREDTTAYSDKEKKIQVLSESGYNEIAAAKGSKNRIHLEDEKDVFLINDFYSSSLLKTYKGKTLALVEEGRDVEFNIKGLRPETLLNQFLSGYVVVVKDKYYSHLKQIGTPVTGKAYIVEDQEHSEALTGDLYKALKNAGIDENVRPRPFSAFYDNYRAELMGSGLTIFIGAFLGLVFLLATGSIIFFKQLSEANEDKKRYHVLMNIGFDKKDIKTIISKQMLFIFMLPLVVGTLHSLVALSMLKYVLYISIAVPATLTVAAYTIIYMVYYLLTVSEYAKLVDNKR